VRPIATRTRVVILQHLRERDMAIGTARMASLCLTNSELHVGVDFEHDTAVARVLHDPASPAVVLYPGPAAQPLESLPPGRPLTLVVLDGTWSQARKLFNSNPLLHALPRVALQPDAPSEYRIRPEPRPDYVSTIEALFHALAALEGDREKMAPLLAPFRAMVQMQVDWQQRTGGRTDRHSEHRKRLVGKPPRLPRLLAQPEISLVCVVAEANTWSREQAGGWPSELVHWLACRVPGGETFERVVAPRNPLAPATSRHLRLAPERLRQGGSVEELLGAWRAWLRPGDIPCTWGRFAGDMFAGVGGELPTPRLELRKVVGDWVGSRPPPMPEFLRSRGLEAGPLGAGRGGERLGQLVRVARLLRERALAATSAPEPLAPGPAT
jgi:DTW domain-containing protein YfiP